MSKTILPTPRVPASLFALFLLIVCSAFAQTPSSFPPPVTPEIPVSPTTYAWAAGAQSGARAASNGDVTLVAWNDGRTGVGQSFAARISRDGEVLDRLGIPLGVWGVADVVWNGDAFVLVIGNTGFAAASPMLIFIDTNGAVVATKPIALQNAQYVAATGSGANVRFLFLELIQAGGGAAIVDAQGNVVNGSAPLWKPREGFHLSYLAVGGPTPSGFLVLAAEYGSDYFAQSVLAAAIDRDGQPIFSTDTHLPMTLDGSEAIAGGSDGYVVLKPLASDGTTIGYRLDSKGAYSGTIKLTPARAGDGPGAAPLIAWDGQQYLIAVASMRSGHSYVTLANLGATSNAAAGRQIADFPGGRATSLSFVYGLAHRFLFTTNTYPAMTSGSDVFMQRFTPALEATEPQTVTFSATRQLSAQVATSATGYAVAWSEVGPDQYVHDFVRRFTADGTPFDPQPIEAGRITPPLNSNYAAVEGVRVASNGARFVIFWTENYTTLARRLGDAPGEWLDPQPVATGNLFPETFASDGKDVLTVAGVGCSVYNCLNAQRIPMTGPLVISPPVPLTQPGSTYQPSPTTGNAYEPSVASNGTDYLLVWSEGFRFCPFECAIPPFRLLSLRLRADGTPIDAAPSVIEDVGAYPSFPSVAWNGDRYLVAWLDQNEIRGGTVTSEGAVHDVDALRGGTVLQKGSDKPPKVAAFDGGFALITERKGAGDYVQPVAWEGVTFCHDCDLHTVSAMPRTTLLTYGGDSYGYASLDASGRGDSLVLAYDHPGDAFVGYVPRVFTRTFAFPVRHRAVTR